MSMDATLVTCLASHWLLGAMLMGFIVVDISGHMFLHGFSTAFWCFFSHPHYFEIENKKRYSDLCDIVQKLNET